MINHKIFLKFYTSNVIRLLLFWFLHIIGLNKLYFYINRRKSVVLTYHSVISDDAKKGLLYFDRRQVQEKTFIRQMKYIKKYFNITTIDDFCYQVENNYGFKKRTCLVTFDDGYRDNYLIVFPILKYMNIPATLFVITDFIDGTIIPWDTLSAVFISSTKKRSIVLKIGNINKNLSLNSNYQKINAFLSILNILKNSTHEMKTLINNQIIKELHTDDNVQRSIQLENLILLWDEVIEMSQYIFTIGCHSRSHKRLSECSGSQLEDEIIYSKSLIESKLSKPCIYFSYPFGGQLDYSTITQDYLKESGYKLIFTTKYGFVSTDSNKYELPRVDVSDDISVFEFYAKISGLWGLLQKIYQKIKTIRVSILCIIV